MAFMMPVVKKDFNLYATSCPSSRRSSRSPSCPQSGASSMSGSPRGSGLASFMSSPRNSTSPAFAVTPKTVGSQASLNKFHNRLLDKLRKTFKSKDDGETSEGASRSSITPL